jgi:hypothetical protein
MRRSADQRLALRGPKPSNHTLTGESRFDDRDEIPFEERLRLCSVRHEQELRRAISLIILEERGAVPRQG